MLYVYQAFRTLANCLCQKHSSFTSCFVATDTHMRPPACVRTQQTFCNSFALFQVLGTWFSRAGDPHTTGYDCILVCRMCACVHVCMCVCVYVCLWTARDRRHGGQTQQIRMFRCYKLARTTPKIAGVGAPICCYNMTYSRAFETGAGKDNVAGHPIERAREFFRI